MNLKIATSLKNAAIVFLITMTACATRAPGGAQKPRAGTSSAPILSTVAAIGDPGGLLASLPALGELPAGWTKLEPGGQTRCALDTPYAYWVRPGSSTDLLVYLQGGGGCWSAETCAAGSNFYDATVSQSDDPSGRQRGIFDLENPENPFSGYTIVYIPSCTGDVHWGNNVRQYPEAGGGSLSVFHRGFVNAMSALAYAFEQVDSAESVFVTGCSAGSMGSILLAPYVHEAYPNARVTQLGDSLSFVFHRPVDLQTDYSAHDNFPEWIPALNQISPGEFESAAFYAAVANHYPESVFAQFNAIGDSVQKRYFVAIGGEDGAFSPAMRSSLGRIEAEAANFRSYTADGTLHCALPQSRFFSLEVDGIRLRDWVADLVQGREVESVRCAGC